jgi:N-acetylglucosaminyldiphosphoundecaprenol N-acetyl-beta-D-mannosaminyltransferase
MQQQTNGASCSTPDPVRVNVGGVPVDAYSRSGLANRFYQDAIRRSSPIPKLIFSMNGEGIYHFHHDKDFRNYILQADIVHADGMSVVKAGNKFTDVDFPERVATTDLFHDIARICNDHGLSMFFVGGREGVVTKAAENVINSYPGVKLLGYHHGYFQDGSCEERRLIASICKLEPDIVFVGLGRPRQEAWCISHRDALENVTWLKTCGGLFDFLSGKSERAPSWMIDAGLEWLFRLLKEPRRLFIRYFITNIYSLYCYRFKR